MNIDKILTDWNKKHYKPVYWLEGEEEYYIDKLIAYAETKILGEGESAFNLTIFYGRDSNWGDILNACRRYPMFSERQVVIVKEAQNLKEIDKLEAYIETPLHSTILVIAFKDKKLDGRTRFSKLVKEKTELVSTKKLSDNALPEWVSKLAAAYGYTLSSKANALLVDHIGNDLNRIENEIEKITINLPNRKSITEDDIENYVGISKDYNSFELQAAIANKDLPKAIQIIGYFGANPKAAPMPLLLPSLYGFFSKVYMLSGASGGEEQAARQIGVPPYFLRNYLQASKMFSHREIEKILLLLHQYNLKSIGINSAGKTENDALLKEMVIKMIMI